MNKWASLLGVLAMIAVTPLARADFNLSIDGTNCATGIGTPSSSGITGTCSSVTPAPGVTVNNFSTTGIETSAFSEQLSSTVSVVNSTSSPVTLTFGAGITGFTSPTTSSSVTGILDASSITLNETLGSATGQLTSCVDQGNDLAPPSGSCASPASGEAGPNPSVSVSGSQTNGNTTFGDITSLSAPFSLQQALTLTLNPNTSLNFTLTQVLTPVPEPASLALLGSALLGAGLLFRRKIQANRG